MEASEYKTAIGKLVIIKLFLTQPHRDAIDEVIEGLETEYLERLNNKEL